MASRLTYCESTKGKWGEVCPDCGQRLPARPKPLTSWHSQRNLDEVRSNNAQEASKLSPMGRRAA